MEEEVDLREYINVLIKWKFLIIWITIIAMLVAGVYSYFIAKPVYEGSALLQIPIVNKSPVNSVSDIQSIVCSMNFASIISSMINITPEKIESGISTTPVNRSNDLIKVTFKNTSPKTISDFFDNLIPALEKFGYLDNDNLIATLKSNLADLKSELSDLTEKKNIINKKIMSLTEYKNPDQQNLLEMSLLNTAYATISSQILTLKQQITDINTQLSYSHNFQYIGAPYISSHPIKPKKLFNIVVAGTAGFFFAILLAFFLEYMQGSEDKKEDKRLPESKG